MAVSSVALEGADLRIARFGVASWLGLLQEFGHWDDLDDMEDIGDKFRVLGLIDAVGLPGDQRTEVVVEGDQLDSLRVAVREMGDLAVSLETELSSALD